MRCHRCFECCRHWGCMSMFLRQDGKVLFWAVITLLMFPKKAFQEQQENRAAFLPACSKDLLQSPPGWSSYMKLNVFEDASHFHPVYNDLNKSLNEFNSFYPFLETFSKRWSRVDISPSQSRDLKSQTIVICQRNLDSAVRETKHMYAITAIELCRYDNGKCK